MKKIKKIILETVPLLLIFMGSVMLSFSLRLINTAGTFDLGNGVTATGGGIEFLGMPVSLPQQNDKLFVWGMIFFIAGSIWEIIKVIVKNFQTSANRD